MPKSLAQASKSWPAMLRFVRCFKVKKNAKFKLFAHLICFLYAG